MSIRKVGMVLAALCVCAFIAPVTAGAATTSPTTVQTKTLQTVPVTGKAHNGKKFTGHFSFQRFITRNGKAYAVGTLTGKLGTRTVKPRTITAPVKVSPTTGLLSHDRATAAATCPVLHLVLGPLNLNLLGLNVSLNQVVLDITAQSGPGNLLGNLVCDVANLLNGPSLLGGQLSGLLNILQQLLNTPGLLNL
jgi:hypothetical protein